MKNFKWPVAVLAFLLTIAVCVGGVYLRQRQLIDEPLYKRLSEYKGVEKVDLKKGTQLTVSVKLGYVEDISSAYQEIERIIEDVVGKKPYILEIVDKRDQELSDAYLAVHLALYESEQRGNFTEMAENVREILLFYGVEEHRLTVNEKRIYFQLRDGESYLYAVIERTHQREEGDRV